MNNQKSDKTRILLILFIVLSLIVIFGVSVWNQNNTSKEGNNKGVAIHCLPNNDKLVMNDEGVNDDELIQDDEKGEGDEEKTPTTQEIQTNEEGQPIISQPVPDSSDSSVDHEGSKEEIKDENTTKLISVYSSIKGLNDEILAQGYVQVEEGKSAFDALSLLCTQNNMIIKTTGFGKFVYVSGINGLNEKAHGAKSGWIYHMNGTYMDSGAGNYVLKDGDVMEWFYVYD